MFAFKIADPETKILAPADFTLSIVLKFIPPSTPIEKVYEFLPYIHVCLVMTVEPGKGGQTMLSEMVQKVQKLKQYIDENNLEVDIEVDGGINLRTMESVKSAGANILVSGSAILKARDYGEIIKDLKS